MVTHNIVLRINHIKAKIDKTQRNSKYRIFDDWHETINHIISECCKLVQLNMTGLQSWSKINS